MVKLQVGKGLSKNEKAQKLALRHWLEAVSTHSYSSQSYDHHDLASTPDIKVFTLSIQQT